MAHWKVKYIALQTFITALLPNKNDTVKKKKIGGTWQPKCWS